MKGNLPSAGDIIKKKFLIDSLYYESSFYNVYLADDLRNNRKILLRCYKSVDFESASFFGRRLRNKSPVIPCEKQFEQKFFTNRGIVYASSSFFKRDFYSFMENRKKGLPWFVALKVMLQLVKFLAEYELAFRCIVFIHPAEIFILDDSFPVSEIGLSVNVSQNIYTSGKRYFLSDQIFSLGKIFTLLLTGHQQHKGKATVKILKQQQVPESITEILDSLNSDTQCYFDLMDIYNDLAEAALSILQAKVTGFADYCDFALESLYKSLNSDKCDTSDFYYSLEKIVETPLCHYKRSVLFREKISAAFKKDVAPQNTNKYPQKSEIERLAAADAENSDFSDNSLTKDLKNGGLNEESVKSSGLKFSKKSQESEQSGGMNVSVMNSDELEQAAREAAARVKAVIDAMSEHYKKNPQDSVVKNKKQLSAGYGTLSSSGVKSVYSVDFIKDSIRSNGRGHDSDENRKQARDEVLRVLEKHYGDMSPEESAENPFKYDFSKELNHQGNASDIDYSEIISGDKVESFKQQTQAGSDYVISAGSEYSKDGMSGPDIFSKKETVISTTDNHSADDSDFSDKEPDKTKSVRRHQTSVKKILNPFFKNIKKMQVLWCSVDLFIRNLRNK